MWKGLFLCFSILFLQLGLLHYVDHRVAVSERQVPEVTTRSEDEEDDRERIG